MLHGDRSDLVTMPSSSLVTGLRVWSLGFHAGKGLEFGVWEGSSSLDVVFFLSCWFKGFEFGFGVWVLCKVVGLGFLCSSMAEGDGGRSKGAPDSKGKGVGDRSWVEIVQGPP